MRRGPPLHPLAVVFGSLLTLWGGGCDESDGTGRCAVDEELSGALPLEVPVEETPMAAAPGECGPEELDAYVFEWTAPAEDSYEVLAQLPAGAKLVVKRTCDDEYPACVLGGGLETALGFSMGQGQTLRLELSGCDGGCEVRIREEP